MSIELIIPPFCATRCWRTSDRVSWVCAYHPILPEWNWGWQTDIVSAEKLEMDHLVTSI